MTMPPYTPPQAAVCYRHPDRPTGLSCSRCGRSACPECLRPAAVGQHCVDCLRNDGIQQSTATTPRRRWSSAVAGDTPYVTYALIVINLIVFGLCVAEAGITNPGNAALMADGSLVKGIVGEGEYWRLLTSGFLHFSVMHVAVNMISLYIIGRDLERALGTYRYLAVYLISLLGGSAAVMLFEADNVQTAGASGAIYGLIGAMLVIVLKARVPATPVLVIIGFNVVLSVSLPGISLMAHLGGLAFGVAATAAIVYLPGLVLPRARLDAASANRVAWAALVTLLVVALGLGVGAGMLYDGPTILR